MERYEGRHLLSALKEDGWYLGLAEESCRQYVHRNRSDVVTVCVRHTDELGPGTRDSAGQPRRVDPDAEAAVVVETTATGFSAHSPELPGCIATGVSEDEVRERMRHAMRLHRDALRAEARS